MNTPKNSIINTGRSQFWVSENENSLSIKNTRLGDKKKTLPHETYPLAHRIVLVEREADKLDDCFSRLLKCGR